MSLGQKKIEGGISKKSLTGISKIPPIPVACIQDIRLVFALRSERLLLLILCDCDVYNTVIRGTDRQIIR